MNKKGIKNTIFGMVFMAGFIGILLTYLLGDIMEATDFAVVATTWTAVCKFANDWVSKDADQSHTKK